MLVLLKQRLIIAGATIGGLFILNSAAAYWAGRQAENTLDEQYKLLTSFPLFKVKSHHYERGWFSSTETTELVFNRKLSGPYESLLPDNMKPMLNTTIKFTHHIKHGPFPGLAQMDFRPARAVVTTEFAMSDATRKTLKTFFGDKDPITITNRLRFGGGGELKVAVPSFDYEEALSGVKMKWKGFDLKLDYAPGYKEYRSEAISPGFLLEASTKGRVAFDGVHYVSDIRPGNTGVKLGTSELSVDNVQFNWKDSVPYSIKLNELLYLMTRIRVGEFINPSGEFRPSSVTLKTFHYQIVTSEQDEFINTRGKADFAEFNYNDQHYGPMRLDISANHLHGPTLIKLDQAISAVPVEGVDPAQLRKQYINTIKANGIPLLEQNPKLLINEFYLKMPTGETKLQGTLGLTGFKAADLQNPLDFLKRIDAQASISLPRQTLENLVVAQARNLFTVDHTAEEQPNMQEVDDLAKNLLDSQLSQWEQQHYITLDKAQVSTQVNFKEGILNINKKKVALPWEETDNPDNASQASAAPVKKP